MSQYLSQVPMQVMRQEMRLTPQLIQSMDILQLNVMALENRIREEMEKNPVLDSPSLNDRSPGPEQTPREERPGSNGDGERFEQLERITRQYDLDMGDRPYQGARRFDGERDAKLDAMANTASRPSGLDEYLHNQWSLLDLPGDIARAGAAIIDHIEDDGYLRTPLAQVAESVHPPLPLSDLEEALTLVQELEPDGVGARDLRECLLLQLANMPGDNRIEETLVRDHLEDLVKNRYPAISKATGYSIPELQGAAEVIGSLTPHPGHTVVERQAPRVAPDVIVDYADDGRSLEVRLTRGNAPQLRFSPQYLKMVQEKRADKSVRDYLRKQMDSAQALMDAIQFRRRRLLEVAQAAAERQAEFFEKGPSGLKVLRMSELAERLECDPSTISRTVADKYMQTPRGIFPLRYFFTGGTEASDGEATSWDSVKARVKEIIDHEDSKEPLSDDQVTDVLRTEGIDVSRRTIAKYRQQLNIPPARQRRKFE